ncbi:UNVERIFIED_CONTAM: hypothetical protein Cloal_3109 [Acetivibrio alkalicellulosi]
MIKTCKCGNVMSDATVPNKIIYWTYFEDEWEKQILEILEKIHFPFIRTVWHCDKCDRLYNWEPKDNKLYTYFLENQDSTENECSCSNEFNKGTLLKVYSYNDFESPSIQSQIRNGEEVVFPRKVEFCPRCKRVFVFKDKKIKAFYVEEVTDLKIE